MAKTKQYKVNSFNIGVLPHSVSDVVGVNNFDKIQAGETISLSSDLPPHILQYLDEVEVVVTKTKTIKKEKRSK